MSGNIIEDIKKRIQESQRILVVSHIRPDGDAVGSLLGFGLALEGVGKDVQMVLSDGVPNTFKHLEGADKVRNRSDGEFDLVVTLDCSDLARVGDALNPSAINGKELQIYEPDINIDHHISNLNFGRINLVEPRASATAELLAKYMTEFNLPITKPVASALLTGMITDTLGFRTASMTSEVLRIAADLMDAGANLPELYRVGFVQRSFDAVRYWGCGLTKIKRDDGIVWTTLTRDDRRKVGYPGKDDADLVNVLSSIEDAEIAITFIEQRDSIKVSWRARPGLDVAGVALEFGGGGHKAASGADISGSLPEVEEKVLAATKEMLFEKSKRLSLNSMGYPTKDS